MSNTTIPTPKSDAGAFDKPGGTLICKWNEIEVPLREILALTPVQPLYGHRTGKQAKTHWCAFIKQNNQADR